MMMKYESRTPSSEPQKHGPVVTLVGVLVAGIGVVGFVLAMAVVRAFVISMLWAWYVVPAFGLIAMSLPTAFGVGLLMSYLSQVHSRGERSTEETLRDVFLVPAGILLAGWIGTWFL